MHSVLVQRMPLVTVRSAFLEIVTNNIELSTIWQLCVAFRAITNTTTNLDGNIDNRSKHVNCVRISSAKKLVLRWKHPSYDVDKIDSD